MKTILRLLLIVLGTALPLRAATETSISALTELTTAASDDALVIGDKSGSTYTFKRITFGNLGLSITSLGTVTTGTLAAGVTIGDVTMNLTGTDATGDTYYRGSDGILKRLPIGTSGQVLSVSGGLPAWAAAGTGSGDLLAANNLSELTATASTARTNLGLGTAATKTAGNGAGQVALYSSSPIIGTFEMMVHDSNGDMGTRGIADFIADLDLLTNTVADAAFQPLSSVLTAIDVNSGTVNLSNVTLTLPADVTRLGSSISLSSEVTGTLPVANGGTGATTASAARTALGIATAPATLFVRSNGNDTTGARGDPNLPYATLAEALNDASAGDTIDVGPGTFASYFSNTGNWKNGITIRGAGRPRFNSATNSSITALEGGTIFTGTMGGDRVTGTSALRGLRFYDFGVDCGDAFIAGGGTEQDAINFLGNTTYPLTDFVFENIALLTRNDGSAGSSHGLQIAGADGLQVANCAGVGGAHVFAVFAKNFNLAGLRAIRGVGDGLILKQNTTAQPCQNGNVSDFVAVDCIGPGLRLNRGVRDVNVNGVSIRDSGKAIEFLLDNTDDMVRVNVSGVVAYGLTSGINVSFTSSGVLKDCGVSHAKIRGTLTAAVSGIEPLGSLNLEDIVVENFDFGVYLVGTLTGRRSGIVARENTYAVYAVSGIHYFDDPITLYNNTNDFASISGSVVIKKQIEKISNLTSNGLVTTSGSDGSLSITSAATFASTSANTFTGIQTLTSPVTTGSTSSSGLVFTGNSLTSGTGIHASSSSLTSGKLLNLEVTGTAAAAGHAGLSIGLSGANASSSITTTGATISNTRTGTTSSNVALTLTASGATTNTALNVTSGDFNFGVAGGHLYQSASSVSLYGASDGSACIMGNGTWTLQNSSQNAKIAATSGTLAMSGAIVAVPDSRSGAGAVSVTSSTTLITSTGGGDALTLANGTAGQIKYLVHDVDGGSAILTPSTKTGFSTITFTNAGDTATLIYVATRGWMVLSSYGATVAP